MSEIERFMKKLDDKFDQFRKEFREEQEKVATTAARKARQEPRYTFKKKSHEEQSKVNEKVDEAIKEAESELQTGDSSSTPSAGNIKAALESLKQGRLLVVSHSGYRNINAKGLLKLHCMYLLL